MGRYLLRRLAWLIPTCLGVVSLIFLLRPLIPGDPIDFILGESAQAADREALRRAFHLDEPLARQYLLFLKGLTRGNLGVSIHSRRPVVRLIRERYPATLKLTLASILIALVLALPLGVLSAVRRESALDHTAMAGALLGAAMPNFWLGPLLILLFAVQLGWLPVSGAGSPAHLVLPALTLGTSLAAILTRMVRSSLLEVIGQEYMTTARAKGLSEGVVICKHGLRNALIPVITLIGLQFGALLAGSIITETIFAWPGLGRLTVTAIQARDFPLLQGCLLTISLSYVLINLLTDLAYAAADPRIRLNRGGR